MNYKLIRKNNIAKTISILLSLVLVCMFFSSSVSVAADHDSEYQVNLQVRVEGKDTYNVKTVHLEYPDNAYISLRDLAVALNGTSAQYSLNIDKNGISMKTGEAYSIVGGENEAFEDFRKSDKAPNYTRKKNWFEIDGNSTHYYTVIYETTKGVYDCYMYLTDIALVLGVEMEYEGNSLYINPDRKLVIDPVSLEQRRFFYGVNGALVGDATTGEIYYSYLGKNSAPMASTTKLMTYAVVMDAVARGELELSDKTTYSAAVEKLSYSPDYNFHLKEGKSAVIEDLLYAMLIPSSNESALALAEAVCGSEQAFVKRMNDKARDLGMSDETVFFNCHGLPYFTEEVFEAKIQNHISAEDMFKLVCYIEATYPQITEITSCTYKSLPSMGITVYNTNSMLFNMTDSVGLKTGTTNKAGCCLVSAIETQVNGGRHLIVAIEFGAEDMITRNSVSKALLTYGREVALGEASIVGNASSQKVPAALSEEIPTDPDSLARKIVWAARNYIEAPVAENIDIPEEE